MTDQRDQIPKHQPRNIHDEQGHGKRRRVLRQHQLKRCAGVSSRFRRPNPLGMTKQKCANPYGHTSVAPRKMPFATWAPGGSNIAAKIPSASTAAQTSKNFRYTCQSIAMISVGFTKVAHTTSCSICRATKVKERAGERSCLTAVQRRFLSRKE